MTSTSGTYSIFRGRRKSARNGGGTWPMSQKNIQFENRYKIDVNCDN